MSLDTDKSPAPTPTVQFQAVQEEQRSYRFPGEQTDVVINYPVLAAAKNGVTLLIDRDGVQHTVGAGWIHNTIVPLKKQ